MQAIQTKYLCPTNFRGSRIVARAYSRSVIIPYDHALDIEKNHIAAAKALQDLLGWTGRTVSGQLPDGCYAHVFVPSSCKCTF